MNQGVRCRIEAPSVAVVTLDHPPVNALSREVRIALIAAFDALDADTDVRAIVLTAKKGKSFAPERTSRRRPRLRVIRPTYARANRLTWRWLFLHPGQFEAGHRGGAGRCARSGLRARRLLRHDLRRGERRLRLAGDRRGPGRRGASFMQRILPPSKFRRMMLTGERVPAAEFYRLGAVEACVSDGELMPAALGMASVIAAKPAGAVRRIRGAFSTVEALSVRDGFHVEAGLHEPNSAARPRARLHDKPSSNGARRANPSHAEAMEPQARWVELGDSYSMINSAASIC